MAITYADDATCTAVEAWVCDDGDTAADKIGLHLESLYSAESIHIVSATLHPSGFLVLEIGTDRWEGIREFGLLKEGTFIYDRH